MGVRQDSGMGSGVRLLWGAALCFLVSGNARGDDPISFSDLEKIAAEQKIQVNLPMLPSTPEELRALSKRVRHKVERGIDRIVQRSPERVSFTNTVLTFDSLMSELDDAKSTMNLLLSLDSEGPLAKDAAQENLRLAKISDEVYLNVKLYERLAFFSEMSGLDPESRRLLEVILECFSARPQHLKQVIDSWEMVGLSAELDKQVARFGQNLYVRKPLRFTRDQLKGLPKEKLDALNREGNEYLVSGAQWNEYAPVLTDVVVEETRRLVWLDVSSGAPEENKELVDLILAGRARIAHRLGYASWSDHNLESASASARSLLAQFGRLKKQTAKIFDKEKREITARLGRAPRPWDIAFVIEQMAREFAIDDASLRPYFEFEGVLDAMLRYSETIFGLRIRPVTDKALWPQARLFAIFDEADGAFIGTFVLDPFVRPGKEPWFMELGVSNAEQLSDGARKASSAYLHASYPAPDAAGKSLMTFDDAATLFHEFGHVLHELLPRQTRYFLGPDAGNADLIEFPSILLETLARQPEVIRLYAKHHLTGETLSEERIQALSRYRQLLPGHTLRRRLADLVLDLKLHGARPRKAAAVEREVFAQYYYPLPRGVSITGSSRFLVDYDAFGWIYSLADAMAQNVIDGFRARDFDLTAPGMAMEVRRTFYEAGSRYSSADLLKRTVGKKFRLCTELLKASGLASEP